MNLFALFFFSLLHSGAQQLTSLDRYIRTPHPSYRFDLVNTISTPDATTYVLDMVSQNWRSLSEVGRSE